jgi:hypothetical protein
VGHFAVSYHNEAAALGIDLEELYSAMKADGEVGDKNMCCSYINLYVSEEKPS